MAPIVIEDRIYLDSAGQATLDVEQAATLWATPGMEVSEAEAAAVGYTSSATGGAKAVKAPRGAKVVEAPEGDK